MFPDEVIYLDVEATSLNERSRSEPVRLTLEAISDLVATFSETAIGRRPDGDHFSGSVVESSDVGRADSGDGAGHSNSHGGD